MDNIEEKNEIFLATASWCGPCQMLKSKLNKENIQIEFKQADDDREFFKKYNIKSIPRLIILKNDELLESVQGMDDIISRIKIEQA
jgi:thioredoxin 1